MRQKIRVSCIASAVALSLAVSLPARAGLVSTDEALSQPQAVSERQKLKAALERPDIAKQLQDLGVPPGDAQARVDAMTDAEAAALNGKIAALPAGGLTNQEWLLIIIAILLLVIAL